MKVFRIILVIALALFSMARLAFTCSRKEENKKAGEFQKVLSAVETERLKIFAYNENDKDSITWMVNHTKTFNIVLDSYIREYRDNYKQDEKRYAKYLAVLYEYKKIYYVYDERVKALTTAPTSPSDKKPKKFRTHQFGMQLRSAMMELRRVEFQLNYDY